MKDKSFGRYGKVGRGVAEGTNESEGQNLREVGEARERGGGGNIRETAFILGDMDGSAHHHRQPLLVGEYADG